MEVTGGPEVPFHPGREVRLFIPFLLPFGVFPGFKALIRNAQEEGVKVVGRDLVVYSK